MNVRVCHRCPMMTTPCGGACPCKVDGIDIARHVVAGYCPHPEGPRFGTATRPSVWEPDPPFVPPPPQAPVPLSEWPLLVRAVAKLRTPDDIGVGDTVKRMIVGGDTFEAWYERLTGKSCGCADRRARLNFDYPYRLLPHSSLAQ
jgi:hypothetical protein